MTYNLGLSKPSNMKADMGSAVHKVLEWLAEGKKYIQDNPGTDVVMINSESYPIEEFTVETVLTDDEVNEINKARISKTIYKSTDVAIKNGHKRLGVKLVKKLIDDSSKYYSEQCSTKWPKASFRDVENWTWIALDYNNGDFDPRLRNIKFPEKHFDLKIEQPWAHYEYVDCEGKTVKGQYGIKGTVDLITELDSKTLEVIDWKTGQRVDWATGEVKTYSKLCDDTQLMMYYYALSRLFPEYDSIIITIFFIRDGGPFTMCFEKEHMKTVEERLQSHYNEVRNCSLPKMCSPDQSSFKCTRLCNFYSEKFDGDKVNKCKAIHESIKNVGIDTTIQMYKAEGFDLSYYEQPGT